jgi:3-oxoacid CoA-transferase
LIFSYAANNFNGAMARNAKLTIVEAEEIVPIGTLEPNEIHVPGIYVDRIVKATEPKQVELLTVANEVDASAEVEHSPAEQLRRRIASRAAREIKDGYYINLGVGIPTVRDNSVVRNNSVDS